MNATTNLKKNQLSYGPLVEKYYFRWKSTRNNSFYQQNKKYNKTYSKAMTVNERCHFPLKSTENATFID